MKHRIVHIAGSIARCLVVLLTLVSLVVSGASAAERLYAAGQESRDAVAAQLFAQLVEGPPAPDEAGDNMTPSHRRPVPDHTACLVMPLLTKTDNSESRVRDRSPVVSVVRAVPVVDRQDSGPIGSTAQVATQLGRQFTLLGERPSGTS